MQPALARSHANLLVALLIGLALLAKVAVPTGWMPVTEDGVTRVTLCTGYGAVEAWVDSEGRIHRGQPDGDGHAKGDPPCAFSAAATPFAAPWLGDMLAVRLGDFEAFVAPLATIVPGRGLAAPPPPPTGPPAYL